MRKIKKAFSIVEIMFVIAIITFLSASSVNYFNKFVDKSKLDKDLFFINNNIEKFNNKVNNKECYDYEIIFSKDKEFLTYSLNQTLKKSDTKLVIDKATKSFTMSTSLTNTWFWEIKIYSDNKKLLETVHNQINPFTWTMWAYQDYYIKSKTWSGEDILWILYFSEDNLTDSWIPTSFVEASTNIDKTGLRTNNIVLKNINKKISFYSWTTLWDTKEIYLFFEKGWYEDSIKITNN